VQWAYREAGRDIHYRTGALSLALDVNPLGFSDKRHVHMAARKYAMTEAVQESFDP